ncbi:hypothetical protein Ancab_033497 [Ancistrocladus abbreviatus]
MQAVTPPKRKRGRPRKDESQAQGQKSVPKPPAAPAAPVRLQAEKSPANPISDAAKGKEHVQVHTSSDNTEDEMVGQVVTGVLESSFDAGYFLTVKLGDTDTYLRGVVFEEGKYVPVTPENDIAPGLKMLKRKEVPILDPNLLRKYTLVTSSKSAQDDAQAVQLDKQASFVASNQAAAPEPHFTMPSASASTACPSASTATPSALTAPLADEFPKNNTDASQKGVDAPGTSATSEALSQVEQQKNDENPDKVPCNSEASPPKEGLKTNADPVSDLGCVSGDKQNKNLREQEGSVEKDGIGTTAEEEKGEVPESEPALSIQPVDKQNEGATEKDGLTEVEGPKIGDEPQAGTEPASILQEKPISPKDKGAQEILEESPAKKMKMDLLLGADGESTDGATCVSRENAILEMGCNSANTSLHEAPVPATDDSVYLAKETTVRQLADSLTKTASLKELTPSTAEKASCIEGLELGAGNVVDDGSMGPCNDGEPMDTE